MRKPDAGKQFFLFFSLAGREVADGVQAGEANSLVKQRTDGFTRVGTAKRRAVLRPGRADQPVELDARITDRFCRGYKFVPGVSVPCAG
ncbi:hypothetical protein SDC9_67439 [bioreactor metagenome]|uniref:Uncharacterized protein n=1 Tax=bioreactor metagenome TaxID=1076179 RepID=A0A644XXQ0_9ZZZZ